MHTNTTGICIRMPVNDAKGTRDCKRILTMALQLYFHLKK